MRKGTNTTREEAPFLSPRASSQRGPVGVSRWGIWAGYIVSVPAGLLLLYGGIHAVINAPFILAYLAQLECPSNSAIGAGVAALVVAIC